MFDEGEKLRREFGADSVFDFSLGNPDLEPPRLFAETLERFARDPATGTHGYMPNAGYPAVRASVAARASRDQELEIPASNVVMSVGAAGAMNVILRTLLDPGDEVIVISPWFAEYWFYIQNYGGRFVEVPSGPGFHLDLEALGQALSPRTAAIIINSPNNPTGVVYTRAELSRLAALLSSHGRSCGRWPCLISDEPYRALVYGGIEVPSVMALYPETIVATSWSKSLSLPGERIGYLAVSPKAENAKEVVDGLIMSTRILGFVNAPALLQRVVAELLEESSDVTSYERRGRLLASGLRAAGYEFNDPEGAFYLFVRVPRAGGGFLPRDPTEAPNDVPFAPNSALGDDVAFAMHLKKFHILAVPGTGFGSPGWFRLSFCVPETTIKNSLPIFARAIEEWGSEV